MTTTPVASALPACPDYTLRERGCRAERERICAEEIRCVFHGYDEGASGREGGVKRGDGDGVFLALDPDGWSGLIDDEARDAQVHGPSLRAVFRC